jgi:GNAT superfamily N-acetyltransferase
VATFTVVPGKEGLYDSLEGGKWVNQDESYMSLYRIAVGGSSKCKGVGSFILAEVERLCLSEGLRSIRTYTKTVNYITQRFLEKNRYVKCGTISNEIGNSWIGYEKLATGLVAT